MTRWAAPLPTILARLDDAIQHALGVGADLGRVTRFLAGRSRFQPRADDIYVATYPRSGTTWVHAMVYLLTHRGDADFAHISSVAPWWERTLSHRADAPERLAKLPAPRVFKSHARREWLPRQGRMIYVARNPSDVARSYYRLYVTHLGFTGGFDAFMDALLAGRLQYGRPADHVAAWSRHRSRILWLEYEQIHREPRAALRRIARFLELDPGPELIDRVAKATHIDQMRANAHRYDHGGEVLYQRGLSRDAFIGEGGVGRVPLAPHQARALEAHAERPRKGLEWRIDKYLR